MQKLFSIFIIIILMTMTSCGETDYVVTIKTSEGDMVAILYDETPKHKENFIRLAKEHYYDSTLFHRVMQGFMIQGGDPDSKMARPGTRLGGGGPSYTVEAEFNPKFLHEKGALCAARQADQVNPKKASSGSQFYIVQGRVYTESELKTDQQKFNMALQQYFQDPANKADYDTIASIYQSGDMKAYEAFIASLKPKVEAKTGQSLDKDVAPEMVKLYTTVGGTPSLDGEYTVFGKVIKGLDVVDKIAALPVDPANRPAKDIRMTVTVEELSRDKIEKQYGYTYPEKK